MIAAICADCRYGSLLLPSRPGMALGATRELAVRRTSPAINSSLYLYVPGAVVELVDRLGCWYMAVDTGRSRIGWGGGGPLRCGIMGAVAYGG